MNVVYLFLLAAAFILLLVEAFSSRSTNGKRVARFLPLALACWVLVPLIQTARVVF